MNNNNNIPPAPRHNPPVNMSAAERRAAADAIARGASTNGGGSGGEPAAKRCKPDPSMTVTTAELQRARDIRQALHASTQQHKKHLWSDYDFAQHAITSPAPVLDDDDDDDEEEEDETMAPLLQQMYKLQCFREDYKIQDTVEEGVSLIQQLMELMPGYLLSVDFAPRYGSYIAVFDYAAFRPEKLRLESELRVFLGASYYIFQCLSTNLRAIRSGVVFITECQGMSCGNFNMLVEEKFQSHLFGHYPFRHKECLWLNTPTIANIAYALLKPLVPRQFLATWKMGCRLDGYEGRIDSLFKMPTAAIAQEQLLRRIQGFLTERGQNARAFELSERVVLNPPPPQQQQQAQNGGGGQARAPQGPGQARAHPHGAAGAGAAQQGRQMGAAAAAQGQMRAPQGGVRPAAQGGAGPAAPQGGPAAAQGPVARAQGRAGPAAAQGGAAGAQLPVARAQGVPPQGWRPQGPAGAAAGGGVIRRAPPQGPPQVRHAAAAVPHGRAPQRSAAERPQPPRPAAAAAAAAAAPRRPAGAAAPQDSGNAQV